MDGAGAGVALFIATHDLSQADSRVLGLPFSGLPSQLPDNFHHLSHSRGPYGMPLREETSAGVNGNFSGKLSGSFIDQATAFSWRT
jgi:hypothetical protein